MTPEERFERIERNLDSTAARLDRMAADREAAEEKFNARLDAQEEKFNARMDRMATAQEQARKDHEEAMSELYSIVTQIGQQTLIIGQRLTELINAMRRGERNGT